MLHLVACSSTSSVFRMADDFKFDFFGALGKGEKTLKEAKVRARQGERWKGSSQR